MYVMVCHDPLLCNRSPAEHLNFSSYEDDLWVRGLILRGGPYDMGRGALIGGFVSTAFSFMGALSSVGRVASAVG